MDIRTERLRKAFEDSGLSQTELCDRVGITKGAMSSYLSGRYFPKQRVVDMLAEALHVPVLYLMGFDDNSLNIDQADSLFIEKYGQQLYSILLKMEQLDPDDRNKVDGFASALLSDNKYKRGPSVEKVI